ncbi:unnamed protein product [Parnassius mnemosyne]
MKPADKLCILIFDEMSLKANITYNESKDLVVGFVNNGRETKPEFADHAQVFMIRGLLRKYKQPVAYTFAQAATKGPELALQIKTIIENLQETGFNVVATVCDQGTNNRNALNLLLNETRVHILRSGQEVREETKLIIINDKKIVPLYDPPHLLKGIRNNLLEKNLRYTSDNIEKTAKWNHIKQLHEENPAYKGIRLVPKLSDSHVDPMRTKMKVKFASQVFSRTVSSTMGYLADFNFLTCSEHKDKLISKKDIDSDEDVMQCKAKKYFKRCFKRKN